MMKLPKTWRFVRIGDIGEVQGGRQRSPYATGQLRPYLRVANVHAGYIDYSDVLEMPFGDEEFKRFSLVPGDILLNEGQSLELVGRSAIYDGPRDTYAFQNTLIRFRCGKHIAFPFAATLFSWLMLNGKFSEIATKTTSIAHLGVSRFADLEVPLPPVPEQQHISSAVQSVENGINNAEARLAAAKRRRQALMQQLLTGKRRFPGFSKPWKTYHLGDLFDERRENGRGDLPLLSITASEGVINRTGVDKRDTSNPDKSKYLRVTPGDIGYNTMRMWQGVCGLSGFDGIVSPAYTVAIPRLLIRGDFAALLFKFPPIIYQFWRYSQGMVDDTLNLKFPNFSLVKVRIPCPDEQKALMTLFKKIDHEISILERLLVAYQRQKRALMQQLLTGKRRVPVKKGKQ